MDEPIANPGVDEKSFKKRHKHLAVVNDPDGSRVVHLTSTPLFLQVLYYRHVIRDGWPFVVLQPGFSGQNDDGSGGTPSISSNAFCSGIDRDTARVVFPPTSISPTLILCRE